MKRLIRILRKDTKLIFAIKRELLFNGEERLTPVVRESTIFAQWIPIVKVNNTYTAMDIWNDFKYTEKDCVEFIQGYKAQLDSIKSNLVQSTGFQQIV